MNIDQRRKDARDVVSGSVPDQFCYFSAAPFPQSLAVRVRVRQVGERQLVSEDQRRRSVEVGQS